jgi:hypothetical protein
MEPDGSLKCSQQPITDIYPESDDAVHIPLLHFFNINFHSSFYA